MSHTCKNCGHRFKGNFCNQCGQTANTLEINFQNTILELQVSLIQLDKGFFYTTRELLLRPGKTIRDYLMGKRVKHFKPFAYVLVLSTIYALITELTDRSNFLTDFLEGFYNGTSDEAEKSDLGVIGDIFLWMTSHYAYTSLLIIPLISLASFLCFYRQGYNYFQHLVLNSYLAGLRTVFYLLVLILTSFSENQSLIDTIDLLKVFLGIILTFWTYDRFFHTLSAWKKIGLTLLHYHLIILILLVLMVVIALFTKLTT